MDETTEEPTIPPKQQNSVLQTKFFQTKIGPTNVYFQLVRLTNSCFLWIGDDRKVMDNLCVALPNPFEKTPLLTTILDRRKDDELSSDNSQRIASKLSPKLNGQVFVTYAVESQEQDVVVSVEKFLFDLIRNGEKFFL